MRFNMINTVRLKALYIILFAIAPVLANAQDYVVTTRGDSLTGEVRPLLYGPEKKVQLITADKNKTTYTIFQVREFSSAGEVYHPVKNDKGYDFMKLIKPGYLSLYAYQIENQTRFDGLFLKKMDGESLAVPNLGFKKYMTRFLDDCPSVVALVESGDLGKKEIERIVDAYNLCVDSRTVDHSRILTDRQEISSKANAWADLESKIQKADFNGKSDALEMVAEIRKKIQRKESIPNFLIEGLKSSLRDAGLSAELEEALKQLN